MSGLYHALWLMLGPKQQFGVGDFTGDGRMDLLIHDGKTSTASIVQFDNGGAIRSRTPAASGWGPNSSWTRGYDYDADGRDDLFVGDSSIGSVKLVRFTSQGTLRDTKVLVAEGGNPDNLRFPGYFMANGRASLLTHQRSENTINHFWFDVVGDDLVLRPGSISIHSREHPRRRARGGRQLQEGPMRALFTLVRPHLVRLQGRIERSEDRPAAASSGRSGDNSLLDGRREPLRRIRCGAGGRVSRPSLPPRSSRGSSRSRRRRAAAALSIVGIKLDRWFFRSLERTLSRKRSTASRRTGRR